MNCEKCQDLISDFLDGALSQEDQSTLNSHLEECLGCSSVRTDLQSLVGFCSTQRGQYSAPPNEKALWLRIRNVIEAEPGVGTAALVPAGRIFLTNWVSRSWELSFAQLGGSYRIGCLAVDRRWFAPLARRRQGIDSVTDRSGPDSLSYKRAQPRIAATAVDCLLEPTRGIQQGSLESADEGNL